MCGLSGFTLEIMKSSIKKKLKILSHRGPDNFQVYEYNNDIFNFMAFNRLSIIDLNKRSNQPYKYKNLPYVLMVRSIIIKN